MGRLKTWLAKAPSDPAQRRLLAANLTDALGSGLFLPLSVIYLTRIVGLSPARAGLGLTIAGFVAIAAPALSGTLLGRFDARWVVVGCFAASAVGFASYIAVGSFASFLVVAILIQFASRLERPASAVLTLGVTPAGRQINALAFQYSLRNFGYGMGGLLAALALLVHGTAPFVVLLAVNAASYIVAGLLVLRLPPVRPASRRHRAEPAGYRQVLRDRAFTGLALLNVIMCLFDSILLVAMPLWIATHTKAPLPLTGLLFTLNTLLAVLLQVRASRAVTAPGGIARSYRIAAASFVLACGAFALAASEPAAAATVLLIVALVALTSAELVTSASEWFVSVNLTPARLRERYLSLFKTSMAVQQAVGPLLVTAVLTGWGRLGWLALASLLAAGTLASGHVAARETARRLPQPISTAPVPVPERPPAMAEICAHPSETNLADGKA
jgi:Major Facilitator Superfamily